MENDSESTMGRGSGCGVEERCVAIIVDWPEKIHVDGRAARSGASGRDHNKGFVESVINRALQQVRLLELA